MSKKRKNQDTEIRQVKGLQTGRPVPATSPVRPARSADLRKPAPTRRPSPANPSPRQKPAPILLNEQDRRALSGGKRNQDSTSSNLGLWLVQIPIVILLILSLGLNYFVYTDARKQAADNLTLTREISQLQEDLSNSLSRVDNQQNEIEQIKQAIKTLESWLTDSE